MPYTALPDHRMPYDNDGTVVGYRSNMGSADYSQGVSVFLSGSDRIELNDDDWTTLSSSPSAHPDSPYICFWWFFPEARECTAHFIGGSYLNSGSASAAFQGSADSTNGVDGTWETASLPSGSAVMNPSLDRWRANIKPISLTGPKKVLRAGVYAYPGGYGNYPLVMAHLYGEKGAGQTPDDIIYINHDDTPGVEFTASEDFGDQPLGTTVVRQFRVKNASATKTANTINIQCNDADFVVSEDNVNWVVTINIASLAAGAESATMYVRLTTPAPGAALGPRFARIVTTVASYT